MCFIFSPRFSWNQTCTAEVLIIYNKNKIQIKHLLGRSRMFSQVSAKSSTVIRKRSWNKQNRTSRRVTDFPQKTKQKINNNYGIFQYKIGNYVFCIIFISIHAIPYFLVGIIFCIIFISIHAIPDFLVGIICGPIWGSIAVQFGDHLRSGIICGLVQYFRRTHF